jgi:hypothetical protein
MVQITQLWPGPQPQVVLGTVERDGTNVIDIIELCGTAPTRARH